VQRKDRSSPRFRFGTSSWSESSWVGPFYPEGTKPADFLSYYATRFDTVEADVTYYRVPGREMVRGWERKVPEGFTLSAKFPRAIVHGGDGPHPDARTLLSPQRTARTTETFLETMSLLGKKCGPLVLQFPYFNKKAFAEPGPFLALLDAFLSRLPEGFRYGVELRNKAWLTWELIDLLRRYKVALVLVDLLYMPHPAELAKDLDLVTSSFVYCRLIGDRKKIDSLTDTFDRIVLDQSSRLRRWAKLLQQLTTETTEFFAYANNHYAGHGPATAEQLAELVTGEKPSRRARTAAPPPEVPDGELPF